MGHYQNVRDGKQVRRPGRVHGIDADIGRGIALKPAAGRALVYVERVVLVVLGE
jgi:uncharacterized membrane protein (Fun14 family)